MPLDRRRVLRAMRPSPWDFSNRVLYDLCRAYPAHNAESVVIAKMLLIGRTYSAAIERRKNKKQGADTDNFSSRRLARCCGGRRSTDGSSKRRRVDQPRNRRLRRW
jgi:hypothetical protein